MNPCCRWASFALLLAACAHSDAFVSPLNSPLGPFGTGADVQLTFNVDQDYWPAWTADGRGILYAFVDRAHPLHRCLGILPPGGGTDFWQLCDNRAIRDDSMSSYGAFAVDSAGRLLATEAVSSVDEGLIALPHTSLWLADTAHPYLRTTLLTFPVTAGTTVVTWLADLSWTGPTTFIALGQQFETVPHCVGFGTPVLCDGRDSLWADSGGVVVTGTIAANRATLRVVAGTEGATAYSLAENGASVVFTLKHDLRLFKVSSSGGTPAPTPHPAALDTLLRQTGELVGVSCKGVTCIVAKNGILVAGYYWAYNIHLEAIVPQYFAAQFFNPGQTMELHNISLSDGTDQLLRQDTANVVVVTPKISPLSGDVVVQVGGGWGHLQTFATASTADLSAIDGNSVLRLYKALVP
jgi:hypothetical protein